jgi:predicted DNA-binding ribbon-helix-helix protein
MNLQPIAETEQLSKRYFQDRVPLGGVAPNHGTILRELPLLEGGTMKSPVIKRSIIIDGHKTSITLEDAFWSGLKEIAHRHRSTLSKLVTQIDKTRQQGNLSSAIRLLVLEDIRTHH